MAERRFNPLTQDWIIVSPGRSNRPWQGEQASPAAAVVPAWSAQCYLCPRNHRTSGAINPDYQAAYVFDNDFPALAGADVAAQNTPLFRSENVQGASRVVCYAPHHNATMASLSAAQLQRVIAVWREESIALGKNHAWVQVFENKGQMMGASSEHPHGQIWAMSAVPTLPAREDRAQRDYAVAHRGSLLLDYARAEVKLTERVVYRNARWLAVVPYWAAWPFELLLLPTEPCASLQDLSDAAAAELADALSKTLRAYDALFGVSFPYSMGWHGRGRDHGAHWQLHAHFYPPLLRSATVRKFMVGFEMLAEAQRDLTPEAAAQRLRELVS